MRLRVLFSAAALLLGVVTANMPVHRSMADLGPCRGCPDSTMNQNWYPSGSSFSGFVLGQ